MYSAQTIVAVIAGAVGLLMVLVARHQRLNHDIGKVPIVSWMTKHVFGLFLLIMAILIFLSQFIVRT
jgi:hypothetical protein